MRHGWLGLTTIMVTVVLSGCTQAVSGNAQAEPPSVPTISSEPLPPVPTPEPTTPPPTPTATPSRGPAAERSGLDVDPIGDECVLNAAELGALTGEAVSPPQQGQRQAGDGSTGSSCVATTGGELLARMNVYRVQTGTPAEYVAAGLTADGRELTGAGAAAAVFDTDAGPTLQVADEDYVVTILVSGATPDDDAWRTAATAALSRLPS